MFLENGAAYVDSTKAAKCPFACDVNYRMDANRTLCYKHGVADFSVPRVEFELSWKMPGDALWEMVQYDYVTRKILDAIGGVAAD